MRGLTPLLLFVLPAVSALSPQFLIRKISTSASIASSSESKISDIDFDQDLVSVVIAQDEDADSPYTARVTHPSFPEYSIRVAEPKLCDPTVQQYSGYLDVEGGKHFFFWFFESRNQPETDPFTLWLNGGPGCSSLTGLFMELGPCRVVKPGSAESQNGTVWNPHSWNAKSNVVFLDQPVNVGFSYSEGGPETSTSAQAAKDVYAFLQLFIGSYKKYRKLSFHVFGESYAGHYIPAIGNEIFERNLKAQKSGLLNVNLKSLGIGNGLVDPLVQFKYYPDMACNNSYHPVLPEATCNQMRASWPNCERLISNCYKWESPFVCVPATIYCEKAMFGPYQETGLNPYDVRVKCGSNPLCYDILGWMESYLNNPAIQKELGVIPAKKFAGCNMDINKKFLMAGDWMRGRYVHELPRLLKNGIKILIYAGDADYICNWIGNKQWAQSLDFDHADEFRKAHDMPWHLKDGSVAGEMKVSPAGDFAFVRVFGAGHMVPYDQPKAAAEMFEHWVAGQ